MPDDAAPPAARPWLSPTAAAREAELLAATARRPVASLGEHVHRLAVRSRRVHERDGLNLNPATNVMNPAAEALLAAGLGTRASLGHPGEKYETGLAAIEEVEVVAMHLAQAVFGARFAEVRVGSGALANAYAFLATCRPGDAVVVPPPTVGGHVTHHRDGAAGLLGLQVHHAPVDPATWSVDVEGTAALVARVRPRLVTIGGSLNLLPHPVAALRQVCDTVGARLLYDAAHVCGLLAGGAWPSPLAQGADIVTMSTYKSLGGPPGGLVLTDDPELARRIDAIAHPGLTANNDAGRVAALAVSLADSHEHGGAYATAMVEAAAALAAALRDAGLPVVTTTQGATASHQLAVDARAWGDGQGAARLLEEASLLASGIGMPGTEGPTALRLGTPEVVRWGMTAHDMPALAELVVDGLEGVPGTAARTTAFRAPFDHVHFVVDGPARVREPRRVSAR